MASHNCYEQTRGGIIQTSSNVTVSLRIICSYSRLKIQILYNYSRLMRIYGTGKTGSDQSSTEVDIRSETRRIK